MVRSLSLKRVKFVQQDIIPIISDACNSDEQVSLIIKTKTLKIAVKTYNFSV